MQVLLPMTGVNTFTRQVVAGITGLRPFTGEALVPKEYMDRAYPSGLVLKAFINDPGKFPQAVAVLQRC